MTVGIVGLGLIGGSFAKAYREAGWTVYAFDKDESVLSFAKLFGSVQNTLTKKNLSSCDLILICISPNAAIEYLRENASFFGKKPIVMDCCGTKKVVCQAAFPLAEKHGFSFIGAHPMAGSHLAGFSHARSNLYHNAPMVLVPPVFDDIALLERTKKLLSPAQFGKFSVTTAEKHDEMIAFTSQLAHVVSNAYIKSPTAGEHKGFSAGSYKDLTRVAWLNAGMWAELFLENGENLKKELDILIGNLQQYRDAIENHDVAYLTSLLEDGKRRKEEVDGR